jgi:hypothetical protein
MDENDALVDKVVDRMQGGPRLRMEGCAKKINRPYHELIADLTKYVADPESGLIDIGQGGPSFFYIEDFYPSMWEDFEVITGIKVPEDLKGHEPFECCC